jgi:transcription-repair coupling factor (superfamily II helicase)
VDAHIPEDYVDSERLRLEAYQKLSAASGPNARENAIDLVVDELTDRYGELPDPVRNLVAVARLRRHAQLAGLGEVVTMGSNLRLAPADLPDSIQVRLQRMYPGSRHFQQQRAISVPLKQVDGRPLADAELIAWVGELLTAIFPLPEKVTEGAAEGAA